MRNISIWEKNTEKRTYPSLSENINAEIAVIGAGLAGILTARRLKELSLIHIFCPYCVT